MQQPSVPLTSLYTREDIWRKTATEIGGIYIPGDFWQPEAIKAVITPWTIILSVMVDPNGMAITRLTTRYLSEDRFTFSVFRATAFSDDGHLNQSPEIEIGSARFDELFRVAGNPPAQVHRLLENTAICRYLLKEPQIGLYAEPVLNSKRRIDLTCHVIGVPEEQKRLVALFELMGETLQHLCAIGSASEQGPSEGTL